VHVLTGSAGARQLAAWQPPAASRRQLWGLQLAAAVQALLLHHAVLARALQQCCVSCVHTVFATWPSTSMVVLTNTD
jgi:hypothetical protein